ncbi:acyl-CoA N-acyltransferase [Choiromyces venosus 120613-1]|uniref:Histone acetyltransferase type B catalytic subunit n=1 Tax=Choiromyces venosus 120613-1 TaxID=1336337 RepID=A0A3N4JUZ9_9PEZI|nr:acyl-CoA N-acyltransferase [Choiromyces venosus 120613-1]
MEEEWGADANEAVELSLLSTTTGKPIATFHPQFTYGIFGESENIFGYKDPNLQISFAANDMKCCLDISYEDKMEPIGSVQAEDLEATISDFLPEDCEKDLKEFQTKIVNRDDSKWNPPGDKISEYTLKGKTYEIWRSTIDDASCRDVLKNIQILVTFYIEGGTAIDLEDEEWTNKRWEVYFLYEKSPANYTFIGYCTCYRYYLYNPKSPDISRIRISQFLILPPFQHQGHGKNLYSTLITHFLSTPTIQEITVEDPSEAFQNLRDLQDLERLTPAFTNANLTPQSFTNKSFPAEDIRTQAKLPVRQFARACEMFMLRGIEKGDDKSMKVFRLLVKARIYKQNKDVLAQLDRLERIDKLHDTYLHVEDEYKALLIAAGSAPVEEEEGEGDDDEEEVEEMDMGHKRPANGEGEAGRAAKRVRVAE